MSKDQAAKEGGTQSKASRQAAPAHAPQADLALPQLGPAMLSRLAAPTAPPALRRLAAQRLQRTHGNQAVRRWLKAPAGGLMRLTDEERRRLYQEAINAYRGDDYATALTGFDRLIREGNLPPEGVRPLRYNRGMCLLRLGRPEEAQPDLDAYIATASPEQQQAAAREVSEAARGKYADEDYVAALALFNSLLNTVTMSPEVAADIRYNRARALQHLGRNEEAIPDLQAYLDTRTDPAARAEAGRALSEAASEMYQRGEYGAAADVYYVLLNGGFPDAANQAFLYNYAMARQRQGQHAEAIARFEQYITGASDPADRAAAEAQIAISRAALSGEGANAPDAQAPDSGPQPVTPPLEGDAGSPDASTGTSDAVGTTPGAAGSAGQSSPDQSAAPDEPQTTTERYQQGTTLFDGGDYWAAIPLFEQVRDSADATPAQRLEAQRRIGLAYHHVGTHTLAAHNLRRYLRMEGADPASVQDALEISERESQRAGRAF